MYSEYVKNSQNSTIRKQTIHSNKLYIGTLEQRHEKRYNDGKKHIKICSTLLVIREKQIKIIRYYYIAIGMTKF